MHLRVNPKIRQRVGAEKNKFEEMKHSGMKWTGKNQNRFHVSCENRLRFGPLKKQKKGQGILVLLEVLKI